MCFEPLRTRCRAAVVVEARRPGWALLTSGVATVYRMLRSRHRRGVALGCGGRPLWSPRPVLRERVRVRVLSRPARESRGDTPRATALTPALSRRTGRGRAAADVGA